MHIPVKLLKILGFKAATPATAHWLLQRISAALLIPLSYWLLIFLKLCLHAAYADTLSWLNSPLNACALTLWLLLVFYHAALGLQVVVEDYVATPRLQSSTILAVNSLMTLLAVISLVAIFNILVSG